MARNLSSSQVYELITGRECVLNDFVRERHLKKIIDKKDMDLAMSYVDFLENNYGEHVKKLRTYREMYGEGNKKEALEFFESELESLLGHISSSSF